MGPLPDHRPRSSARILACPGICPTSISMPVSAESKQSFSTKKHNGLDMVNNLLLDASAPELSERDFKQIGKRWLGKNLEVIHKSAICAKVSKQVMLRCRSGGKTKLMDSKSSWVNFSENHFE